MVLVHGDSASALDWSLALPALARDHRVLAVDLPGNGDSSKPPARYSPALFADAVAAFLDAAGVERAVLVGHSLGGLVAARVALRHPDRVEALCLVAAAGLGRAVTPAMIAHTFPGIGEASLVLGPTAVGRALRRTARPALMLARWWDAPPAWVEEQARLVSLPGFVEAGLRTRRSSLDPWGQRDIVLGDLHRLEMPALVVWGALDAVVPVSHGRAAARALRHGRLEVLPDCGHVPHLERAGAFVDAVARFLGDLR